MAASLAFETDIRAKPDNRPLIGAAGMRFAQTEQVLKLKVGKHISILVPGIR